MRPQAQPAESLLIASRPGKAIPSATGSAGEQELRSARRVKVLRMLGRASSATGAHNDSTTCFAQAEELAEVHDPAVTIGVLLDAALASWILAEPDKSLPPRRTRLHARRQYQNVAFELSGVCVKLPQGPGEGDLLVVRVARGPGWGGSVGTGPASSHAGGLCPGW